MPLTLGSIFIRLYLIFQLHMYYQQDIILAGKSGNSTNLTLHVHDMNECKLSIQRTVVIVKRLLSSCQRDPHNHNLNLRELLSTKDDLFGWNST